MPSLSSEKLKTATSPYINRFLQPDTIIPDLFNPQSWNRYSYVSNSPINYSDPSGHGQCRTQDDCKDMGIASPNDGGKDPDENLSGGGGGSGIDCGDGEICYVVTTKDLICSHILDDCDAASTFLALTGTGLDGLAFLINAPFGSAAAASLIVALLGDPAGWVAYGIVFKAYQVVAPFSTAIGWAGFGVWALQGMITGENQLGMATTYTNDGKLKGITMFGSVAQDTIFSLLNDGLQTKIKEPIVGTIWSGVGVGYDLVRNPFNPSSPLLPTIIQPNASASYNFETNSTSFDFSWFPTYP